MEEKKVNIGKIINTHGLKGEITIFSWQDDVEKYKNYKHIYIEGFEEIFEFQWVKNYKNRILAKFKNYNHINDIEKFIGRDIFVSYSEFLENLSENEYYIEDLKGLDVFKILNEQMPYNEENLEKIGVLEDIIFSPANDVLKIKGNEREILVPNVKEFVKKIDLKNKKIFVKIIKGM